MQEYKNNAVKNANTGIIIYTVLTVIVEGLNIALQITRHSTTPYAVATSILGLGYILIPVSQYFTLTKGYNKTIKMRLVPFALVPVAMFSFFGSLISSFLNIFPFEQIVKNINVNDTYAFINSVKACVSSIGALVIFLALSKKVIEWYCDIFFNNFYIQFSPQFELRKKWWFALVAEIIYGALMGVFGAGLFRLIGTYFSLNENVMTGIGMVENTFSFALKFFEVWLLFTFFKRAFANIDEQTRKLFYPQIVVFYEVGLLIPHLFSPLSTAVGGRYDADLMLSDQVGVVAASGTIIGVSGIISLVLSIVLMKKTLEAFEQSPN